jgi:hypothetical protein
MRLSRHRVPQLGGAPHGPFPLTGRGFAPSARHALGTGAFVSPGGLSRVLASSILTG